jgi:ABC-type glycerol-3-phosphate transport system substrate-binding protein
MKQRSLLIAMTFVAILAMMVMSWPLNSIAAQDPTSTPRPTNTPVILDAGSGSIVINYWNGLTGGDGSVMNQMVEQFVKDNPTYKVHTESYDWNIMFQS